jgi:hypothetical protein
MGEIKSTLDIIMEKTKDLTLTEEEKRAFRKKEVEGKVKGLLLKFLDGLIDVEKLTKEVISEAGKDQGMAMAFILKECLDRIDPEADNELLLQILEHVANINTTSLQNILSEFKIKLKDEKDIREQELNKQILEKGISGSAVLPNIRSDQQWIQHVQDAKEEFKGKLQALAYQPSNLKM